MAKRVPEGPAPDPAVQKLRVQYAKRGRLRFTSTRDFQRALERALRRAQVPMAYSAGFHPHPKISYANAAATGTASEAEYFEIHLREQREPAEVKRLLDEALPPGLDVVAVVEAQPGALADRLEASQWSLRFAPADQPKLGAALAAFVQESEVEVTRMMKKGPRTFDVRSAVLDSELVEADDGAPELRLVLRHTVPAVRPDDLLSGLALVDGFEPTRPPLITRLAQGPLVEGNVADPL
ncbi:TIGR03936 family radical SAM-associated protein [Demetria terragena]|uniref:TIGR03936 family radical SAM-associated protein n=1 Tax=Demetria terragena TaxID=63959 RepID=UPI0003779453|nr:TIGR03936 family radical SAM-associated protein [Demetria terragena]